MEYREIGKAGMKVSSLSFGASSLGGFFHLLRESAGIEAVCTALDHGINFIDVSPYCGHLKAELQLSSHLTFEKDKEYEFCVTIYSGEKVFSTFTLKKRVLK